MINLLLLHSKFTLQGLHILTFDQCVIPFVQGFQSAQKSCCQIVPGEITYPTLGKGKSSSNMPWEKHVSSVLLFPYHFVHIPCTWHVRTTEVALLLDHTDRTRASIKDRQMFKVVPCWNSISWLTLKQTIWSRLLFFESWVVHCWEFGKINVFPTYNKVFSWVTIGAHVKPRPLKKVPRDQFRCFQLWLVVVGAGMSTSKQNNVFIHVEFRTSYFAFLELKTVMAKWTSPPIMALPIFCGM